MASRKGKPIINAAEKNTNTSDKSHLLSKDVLHYLSKPLYLPPFYINHAAYKHFIVDTIRQLLIEAIENILPKKVTAVQFIFTKRLKNDKSQESEEVQGDFSLGAALLEQRLW